MSRFLIKMRLWFFFAVVSFCCLMFIIALCISNRQFRESQKNIIDSQREYIALLDDISKKYENELTATLEEKERTIRKMLTDSAILATPSLCDKQKNTIIQFVKPCWEETTRVLNREERLKGWLNNTPVDNSRMMNDVKSLLELQFNKIQNEYETLEIWAGLLTIVFLVFSFYSLFKSERFEEQSQATANEINHLKEQADEKINKLDERGDKMLSRIERRLENSRKEIQGAVRRTIVESQTTTARAQESFQQEIQQLTNQNNQAVARMRQNITQVEQSFEQELNARFQQFQDNLAREVENRRQQLDSLINDAETLLARLNESENQPNPDHSSENTDKI